MISTYLCIYCEHWYIVCVDKISGITSVYDTQRNVYRDTLHNAHHSSQLKLMS